MTITIYHNPNCGTSRNTLAMIRASGEEPVVVEYLEAGWSPDLLRSLAYQIGKPLKPSSGTRAHRRLTLACSEKTSATRTSSPRWLSTRSL